MGNVARIGPPKWKGTLDTRVG